MIGSIVTENDFFSGKIYFNMVLLSRFIVIFFLVKNHTFFYSGNVSSILCVRKTLVIEDPRISQGQELSGHISQTMPYTYK